MLNLQLQYLKASAISVLERVLMLPAASEPALHPAFTVETDWSVYDEPTWLRMSR